MPLPAAWATTPKIEKMPAPIMPPMPMAMAANSPMPPAAGGFTGVSGGLESAIKKSLLFNLLDVVDPEVRPRTQRRESSP